ncbi:MAG: RecX family transcriptional regulator [Sphingomonas sp.]|nr:RecX family transcriptional regulator [Sphingomonas sp.]
MAMTFRPSRMPRQPFDAERLEQAALTYVGRYATTRARLAAYLRRKLAERGWDGPEEPPVAALVAHMARLGFVDDRAFAAARAASLGRRGYGARRVDEALRAAGVEKEDVAEARKRADADAWQAALRFAERRRIGPFAAHVPDRNAYEKSLAAMLRAGHPVHLARRLISARPGEVPEPDDA